MFDNEKLVKLLSDKHMTVYRLYKLTDLAQPALRRLYSGEATDPTYKTVAKIADVLGVSMDEFRRKVN
ncbi:helix-turn-helix domain-containing protein [Lacticaseibacillus sharpeae]|uniref:HTH cro/C1-type domain-containing protein n=1 Tax=Lacticaseibacillus sharpeae JCM 1186 = DSM 20505 TaxID=1291052 RepID=A0A0R1ZIJ6_9LACO|nr:helix-turn-helix transcriptional regulator [Lacticaseibacillus sharpeae]KRM54785.1 hypothetical protein FC18_GL002200 [Lacticaseibacillus sharpeae JCM 1186 = DSM 20505]